MIEGLFQPMHLLIIAGIALLIFGPKKLPELGKGLGDGIRGFKAAMSSEEKPTKRTNLRKEKDSRDYSRGIPPLPWTDRIWPQEDNRDRADHWSSSSAIQTSPLANRRCNYTKMCFFRIKYNANHFSSVFIGINILPRGIKKSRA